MLTDAEIPAGERENTIAVLDAGGRFKSGHQGTIFLDEVSEIPLELQVKLLRVLQEGEFERIGESTTRKVDVRVIAATNRNLEAEVEAGRFREDLYYRLSVFPLEVPPLRQRREDIVPLATHFLKQACKDFNRSSLNLTRGQADALQEYDWPGNVRELRNVIERAAILSTEDRLRLHAAMPQLRPSERDESIVGESQERVGFVTAREFKRLERENLIKALEHSKWRVSGPGGAAELLGVKPSTLSYQMKVHRIERPR